MNPVSRTLSDEEQKLIDDYIKKGGNVTQCDKYAVSEEIEYTGGFYQKRKRKKEAEAKDDDKG